MHTPISPLAPKKPKPALSVAGCMLATAQAGIKYQNRTDVGLLLFPNGASVAGVFTRSKCPSAPVDWCRAALPHGRARALIVNSGNANAFTGAKGKASVEAVVQGVAKQIGCAAEEVFISSTGVIGEPLNPQPILNVLPQLATSAGVEQFDAFARAIMTTDTFPKAVSKTAKIDGIDVVITGVAKGAGMIAPDMATMLSYIVTDAPIASAALQSMLSTYVKTTFNAISIDGDTSTSDTLMLFATGAATARGIAPVGSANDGRLGGFKRALHSLMRELAQLVVRDGEGAQKFVAINVKGAKTSKSALKIGRAIADSPLVKTALAGGDANWGRVVMAVGKSGEPANRDSLSIWFGPTRVAYLGERDPSYDDAQVTQYILKDSVELTVDLGIGRGKATVWTCDLTEGYLLVNGAYRT